MSALTPKIYASLIARLRVCVDLFRPRMMSDSVDHVVHYIEHGEIEMAYESFVLSCIKEGLGCDKFAAEELRSIGTALNMETESVFEVNFWQLAQEFFARAKMNPRANP